MNWTELRAPWAEAAVRLAKEADTQTAGTGKFWGLTRAFLFSRSEYAPSGGTLRSRKMVTGLDL